MPPPEPALPETRERRCPACQSQRVTPMGRVLATDTAIKSKHWCEACGTAFWLVRGRL
jgi:transcriptional regulator NrdR family protein